MITIKNICKNATLKNPNMAIAFEFVTSWTMSAEDPALLARLSAGAIGVCLDHLQKLPPYRPAKSTPTAYGHKCLAVLLNNGASSTDIFATGTKCLQFLAEQLPNQEEVEEEQDFLDLPPKAV